MRSANSELQTSQVMTRIFTRKLMHDRSCKIIMIDQHVNRYLTLAPVEQLFPVLNQISSYKTNLETLVPVPVLVAGTGKF